MSPSPPSAIGRRTVSAPGSAARTPRAMARAASRAVSVPLKGLGAIKTRMDSDRIPPYNTGMLQHALWLVLMALVMGWLARTRRHAAPSGDPAVLRNPKSLLAIGVVCAGFFVALAVLCHLFPGKDGTPLISLS